MSEWLARARAARAERRAKETINAPHDGSLSLPPETDITAETLTDKTDVRRDHLVVVPDLSNPEDIQAWLIQRTAMREDSGTARVDANRLAFDELLWIGTRRIRSRTPTANARLVELNSSRRSCPYRTAPRSATRPKTLA